MNTLSLENAALSYRDGDIVNFAVKDVTLTLSPGRVYGIMGPSGSGKSSLLYLLSGLKPVSGGVARFGEHTYAALPEAQVLALRRQKFGFVFQQPFLLNYLTALENILIAAENPGASARKIARERMEQMGLGGKEGRFPGQLSGGERQRVAVVRALMNDPEVLFADEPTAALDRTNGRNVIESLCHWRGKGSVVIVTHDPVMVEGADAVAILRDGRLAGFGPPAEVLSLLDH
jgi:putative ABC transport system ATP-binding protein